jgi:hypothetical protein
VTTTATTANHLDTVKQLADDAYDWSLYTDRHGDNFQSREWAARIARQLAMLQGA